mmetsp:Transcript_48927/g.99893  ORF Transcript_48927/g.99893 Transcript_48927/m.99893 type:complete len:121 (-) Transcript_48927:202-564(-)
MVTRSMSRLSKTCTAVAYSMSPFKRPPCCHLIGESRRGGERDLPVLGLTSRFDSRRENTKKNSNTRTLFHRREDILCLVRNAHRNNPALRSCLAQSQPLLKQFEVSRNPDGSLMTLRQIQ